MNICTPINLLPEASALIGLMHGPGLGGARMLNRPISRCNLELTFSHAPIRLRVASTTDTQSVKHMQKIDSHMPPFFESRNDTLASLYLCRHIPQHCSLTSPWLVFHQFNKKEDEGKSWFKADAQML